MSAQTQSKVQYQPNLSERAFTTCNRGRTDAHAFPDQCVMSWRGLISAHRRKNAVPLGPNGER
jgi:hypothetical protein